LHVSGIANCIALDFDQEVAAFMHAHSTLHSISIRIPELDIRRLPNVTSGLEDLAAFDSLTINYIEDASTEQWEQSIGSYRLPQLRRLSFEQNAINSDQALAFFRVFPNVKRVDWLADNPTDSSFSSLADLPVGIEHLRLDLCETSHPSLPVHQSLAHLCALRILTDVGGNFGKRPACVQALRHLPPNVERLTFIFDREDEGLAAVVEILGDRAWLLRLRHILIGRLDTAVSTADLPPFVKACEARQITWQSDDHLQYRELDC
jgi:hypothetical protein